MSSNNEESHSLIPRKLSFTQIFPDFLTQIDAYYPGAADSTVLGNIAIDSQDAKRIQSIIAASKSYSAGSNTEEIINNIFNKLSGLYPEYNANLYTDKQTINDTKSACIKIANEINQKIINTHGFIKDITHHEKIEFIIAILVLLHHRNKLELLPANSCLETMQVALAMISPISIFSFMLMSMIKPNEDAQGLQRHIYQIIGAVGTVISTVSTVISCYVIQTRLNRNSNLQNGISRIIHVVSGDICNLTLRRPSSTVVAYPSPDTTDETMQLYESAGGVGPAGVPSRI